jgi:hypothetical protein
LDLFAVDFRAEAFFEPALAFFALPDFVFFSAML